MNCQNDLLDVDMTMGQEIAQTIKEVFDALKERGYDPISQLVGYIISGDPGYISNYKKSRNKIIKYDRSEILTVIMKEYLKK